MPGPKLLTKSEINEAKSKDLRREIDEGKKIAGRVDALRELHSQEERSLETFRTATLAQIAKETSEALTSRDSILSEVKELRKEKEIGLSEVAEANKVLDNFKTALDGRQSELEDRTSQIDRLDKATNRNFLDAQTELVRAVDDREHAYKLLEAAKAEKITADKILRSVEEIKERTMDNEQEIQSALSAREHNVSARETLCMAKAEKNAQDEQDIATQKLQILDQRRTLERETARLQGKKQKFLSE